jgi:hypothetical protein
MSKKETIDFVKALEENNLITADAHKNEKVMESIEGIISMTEEEHDKFQQDNPNRGVLMVFTEYQDWKETYEG